MMSGDGAVGKDGLDYRGVVIPFQAATKYFYFNYTYLRFQTGSRAHSAFYFWVLGLTTYLNLKSRLRTSGAIPQIPYTASAKESYLYVQAAESGKGMAKILQ
jgi:hypothetical protein